MSKMAYDFDTADDIATDLAVQLMKSCNHIDSGMLIMSFNIALAMLIRGHARDQKEAIEGVAAASADLALLVNELYAPCQEAGHA
jgi:hypothetical protein